MQTMELQSLIKEQIEAFPLYVFWYDKHWDIELHSHNFIEIAFILSGTAQHIVQKTSQTLRRGDVLVIPRGTMHAYQNCSEDFGLADLLFIPEGLAFPMLDMKLLPGFNAVFHGKTQAGQDHILMHFEEGHFSAMLQLCRKLYEEGEAVAPGYKLCQLGLLMNIITELARHVSPRESVKHYSAAPVYKALTYLNKHFCEQLDIQKLCAICNMSRSTLQRNFLHYAGCSPIQYIMKQRIAQAITRLRATDDSLTEIALSLGFSDSNYFGRYFKKITGHSPAAFRKLTIESLPTGN
jgi:AraC-like DNA-binding protein/quercetin dioxygenase-like cupin family protein